MGHLLKASIAFGVLVLLAVPAYFVAGLQRESAEVEARLHQTPLPAGAALQASEAATWEAWLGIKPAQAEALYHYPATADPKELAFHARDLLAANGWDAKVVLPVDPAIAAEVEATRDGWYLHAKTGRWSEALGGCCIASEDPLRPVGMRVEIYPPR